MNNPVEPKLLLSANRIAERLKTLAGEINHYYEGREILLVSILDGAIIFTADLCDCLKFPPNLTAYVFPVTAIPPPRKLYPA